MKPSELFHELSILHTMIDQMALDIYNMEHELNPSRNIIPCPEDIVAQYRKDAEEIVGSTGGFHTI
jgi:hypothetical protein